MVSLSHKLPYLISALKQTTFDSFPNAFLSELDLEVEICNDIKNHFWNLLEILENFPNLNKVNWIPNPFKVKEKTIAFLAMDYENLIEISSVRVYLKEFQL